MQTPSVTSLSLGNVVWKPVCMPALPYLHLPGSGPCGPLACSFPFLLFQLALVLLPKGDLSPTMPSLQFPLCVPLGWNSLCVQPCGVCWQQE